jgi:hypothetical protein
MHKITVKDFPHLDFGDVRRDQRFVTLIESISRQPGSSIPRQSNSWYDTKAAYNFFKNDEVSIDELKKTIGAYGVAQVKDLDQLLIVHDISNISFNNGDVEGVGYLDHAKGNGILSYNSIAVSPDGLPLALIYQHTWVRPKEQVGKSKFKKQLAFEDKESYRWYDGIQSVNTSLGDKVHKIHIADRQADVYELFFNAYEQQTDLLIRAYTNRKLSEGGHLWDNIAQQEIRSTITLSIPDASGKKKQDIEASVRYQQVEILRPSTSKDKYESVELTAIEVKQQGDVNNEADRICWKLLTTLKIESVADVLQCIKWYTYRWLIERFHYVLKSGTKIEDLQLKQATSLQKAISVYSLAAFRIMQLVYESRQHPEASCEAVLTRAQWKTLYMLIKKNNQIPEQPPTLSQAVMWIGRLGGHLGRKSDGPPGLKTVWLGYQQLCNATAIYELTNLGKE